MTNLVRDIAGVSSLAANPTEDALAQHAALMADAANEAMTHYPTLPHPASPKRALKG